MRIIKFVIISILILSPIRIFAQSYVKLNALTAVVGIINPSVEFTLSNHSTYQLDVNISPWKKIWDGKHMAFGLVLNEYRYYFKEHNMGWYLGGSAGLQVFDMSKPQLEQGFGFTLENRYCKGYGINLGGLVGWEKQLGKNKRWIMDVYIGISYMLSYYNGYSLDGEIDMYPHRTYEPKYPDPWNGTAETYPSTIGVSFGYKFIKGRDERK